MFQAALVAFLAGYWGLLSGYVFKQMFVYAIDWSHWLVGAIPPVTILVLTAFVTGTVGNWRCPACRKAVTWRWDVRACQRCGVALR